MIEITMPTSFEAGFLDELVRLNDTYSDGGIRVTELYGSLPRSAMGVGRPSRSLPGVDRDTIERHVADLQARGLHFSYLFNGSCSANREFCREDRARLLGLTEPLHYAVVFCRAWWGTPIPAAVGADRGRLSLLAVPFMRRLLKGVLFPPDPGAPDWWNKSARLLLFFRHHALRMPFWRWLGNQWRKRRFQASP